MFTWRHLIKTQTTGTGPPLHNNYSNFAILQWNARGLRSKLADFRYRVKTYRFPFIAISESRVGEEFRISG